jgi:hypothetical protein
MTHRPGRRPEHPVAAAAQAGCCGGWDNHAALRILGWPIARTNEWLLA